MSHCRRCGRRRHRTVFGQGRFWGFLAAVLAVVWIVSAMRGQA